ncbi:Receptor-like kinase [Quillaja saponaria]|uniref:Receptor-like kinase n=1 Tax=Quillaja saponaria TaxID=32244 RepID=A0AAD7LJI1_QUISA|nr:Receptor-like kinase [Quillaja saponaria]
MKVEGRREACGEEDLVDLLLLTLSLQDQTECKETRCGCYGPIIRFPFQLKGSKQPDYCGHPGFDLFCTNKKETVVKIMPAGASSLPVKFLVKNIDYKSQLIQVYDPEKCLPRQLMRLANSSIYPFQFTSVSRNNISFLNCPSPRYRYQYTDNPFGFATASHGIDMLSCPIYPVGFEAGVVERDLISCTKILDVSSVPPEVFDLPDANNLTLRWTKPNCGKCEAEGKKCTLENNNATVGEIECFGSYKPFKKCIPIKLLATGLVVGSVILLLMVSAVFFYAFNFRKTKEEDEARVKKFLDHYRALKPARFSYADIKRLTNQFKDKLGEGAHGTVFMGKLIINKNEFHNVAVKILNNDSEGDGKEFINEVATMGKIHHVNVIRLVGYCADGFQRALVYDFLPNGSLQKFISSPDKKDIFLGWDKLQEIAAGIAKGIDYLHQGCDKRILHFDIKPHNVLLDQIFTPKISDFGMSKLCSKNHSTVSMTVARGTMGYIAPEVFSRNFGNVSHKSDVYSYGMLLLEMVGERKNEMKVDDTFQVFYPEWIHKFVEGEDIHIDIMEEGDVRIAKKLATVGLWCIQWHPVDRPSMKVVLQMLEGDADELLMPPNPFDSTSSTRTSVTTLPARDMKLELEVIQEIE